MTFPFEIVALAVLPSIANVLLASFHKWRLVYGNRMMLYALERGAERFGREQRNHVG
jgi:hypothetical protein